MVVSEEREELSREERGFDPLLRVKKAKEETKERFLEPSSRKKTTLVKRWRQWWMGKTLYPLNG